jgi:hypothetical protein
MTHLSLRPLALTVVVATGLLIARTSAAQSPSFPLSEYRGWTVCFTSTLGTCTDLQLAVRNVGALTSVSSIARHQSSRGLASGLMSYAWHVDGASSVVANVNPLSTCLGALGGAPAVGPSACNSWRAQSVSTPSAPSDLSRNYVGFASSTEPGVAQFIAGCDGTTFDALYSTAAQSCGTGAYEFNVMSNLLFSTAMVQGISLDIYTGDHNLDGLPDQASCFIDLRTGDPGFGIDLGDPTTVASCTATPISTVPEPSSMLLFGTGLIALTAALRRRSRS